MTPQEYLSIKAAGNAAIASVRKRISAAYERAGKCPLPAHLRRVTPRDVVCGAIFWHPRYGDSGFPMWDIVDEVLFPDDAFKAYVSEGCRYGINGSYIECDPTDPRRIADLAKDAEDQL